MVTGPLFILGAPGSGTSLFYRALCLHPRAAWISNYNRRAAALPQVAYLNRLGRDASEVRRRVWLGKYADTAAPEGHRRTLRERARPRPVQGEPLFRRRRVLPDLDDPIPDAGQLMLRTDLERLTRAAGGGVLVSKHVGHNRRVRLLAEVFPDSRFLVLSRDGRAVVRSLLAADWWPPTRTWWWDGTPVDWVAAGGGPLELAARHWVHEVQSIDEGLAGVPLRRVLRVSYEALQRSPLDVLSGTAVWGGLGVDPGWQAELGRIRFPDRNWLLAQEPVDPRVGDIQDDTLRALGYSA